jgi:hypothetical protein
MTYVDAHRTSSESASARLPRHAVHTSDPAEPGTSRAGTLARLDGWVWRATDPAEGADARTPAGRSWTGALGVMARSWAWARMLGG